MLWLLLIAALCAAALLYAVLTPLAITAEGTVGHRGNAGHLHTRWGPVAVIVDGPEPEARLTVRLLGLRVFRRPLSELGSDEKDDDDEKKPWRWPRLRSRRGLLDGRIRWDDLVGFVSNQRRHFKLDDLRGATVLGFEDMSLTGQVYGHLWTVRSAFPELTRNFQHDADWSGEDRVSADGLVAVRIFIGRIIAATAWFVATRALRPRS